MCNGHQVTCRPISHHVGRRQSHAYGPSLSSGLGPGQCNTDFVSVISAIVTPVSRCSHAAVPLTIKAQPPGSVGGQNNDTREFARANFMFNALRFIERSDSRDVGSYLGPEPG
jgi:hypothetical protein